MGIILSIYYWFKERRKGNIQKLKELLDIYKYDLKIRYLSAERKRNWKEARILKKEIKNIQKDIYKLRIFLMNELDYCNEKIRIFKSVKKEIPSKLMIKRGQIQRLLKEEYE